MSVVPSDSSPALPPVAPNSGADPVASPPPSHGHGAHGPLHSHCENCGTKLLGPYCYHCGQHDFPFHASFAHVAMDALENFFHFEGKFFRNIATLLFRPGQLTVDFNRGHRAAQMPPFRLYLFVSVLFFVAYFAATAHAPLRTAINPDPKATKEAVNEALANVSASSLTPSPRLLIERVGNSGPVADGATHDQAGKAATGPAPRARVHASRKENTFADRMMQPMLNESFREHVAEQFIHSMPRLFLIAVPLFALYLRLLFRKSGFVYLQHLVAALHYHTFVYLWLLLRDGWAGLAGLASPHASSVVQNLCALWTVIYPIWMLRRLFADGWGKTIFKAAILGLMYGLTLIVIFSGGFMLLLALD